MKLCCSYRSAPQYREIVDEIRYSLNALGQALEALEKYPDKIIIIEILDLEHSQVAYDKIKGLITENPNIVIDCYKMRDYIVMSEDPAFTKVMYHYPVNTYNDLWRVLYYKPWAISIAEPLTFDMIRVRQAVDRSSNRHVRIRVLPALGRPTEWSHLALVDNGLRHFWVTPETVSEYEGYIDVLDLYDEDEHREEALVKVFHDGFYLMPLGSLVKNLNSSIPANMFDITFIQKRMNCKQVCMRDPSMCNYCATFENIAQLTRPKTDSLIDLLKK